MLRCLPSLTAMLLALVASALLLVIAGCGGQSASQPGAAPEPGATEPPANPSAVLFAVTMQPQAPVAPVWQLDAGRGMSLAEPSGLLAACSPLKGMSYVEEDLQKDASAIEAAPLPSNLVANAVAPFAVFSPSWTPVNPPGLGGLAYCTYRFALADYAQSGREQTIGMRWRPGFEPVKFSNVWVGLANWQADRWDWFAGPDDGVLTIGTYVPYTAPSGDVLIVIAVAGTIPCTLEKLLIGEFEVRATGAIDQAPSGETIPPISGTGNLLAAFDLTPGCSPVNDQGSVPACTAFAVVDGAYNYELNSIYSPYGWDFTDPFNLTSPRFSYIESGEDQDLGCPDEGRYTDQVIDLLKRAGVATEKNAPYGDRYNFNCAPDWTTDALIDAALLDIESYHYVSGLNAEGVETLKTIIAVMQRPVVVSMALDPGFMDYTSGVWNYAGPVAGYHAMCIVGYDDAQGAGAFKVRNSWSPSWGEAGYVWIGYQTFTSGLNPYIECEYLRDEYDSGVAQHFLGLPPPDLAPPANVQASDGTYTDHIAVTWEKSAGATGYLVYRDAADNLVATLGDVAQWDDASIADLFGHIYWVQATLDTLQSELSTPDVGCIGQAPVINSVTPASGITGTQATFIADVSGSTPITYDWNFGGGATPNTSNLMAPQVTLGASGDYSGQLTVTNSFGADAYPFQLHVIPGYVTDLLVVYNSDIPESVNLAQYYASPLTGRAIDPAYLLGLPLGSTIGIGANESVDRATYALGIRDPIIAFLDSQPAVKANVKYLLLIKGIPLKINNDNPASVDSELCLLYEDVAPGSYPKTDWLVNDYPGFAKWFGAASTGFYMEDDASFEPNTFKVSYDPTWGSPPSGDEDEYTLNYLVGRLTAYTWDEARALVDRSLSADTSGAGWTILDSKNAEYGNQLDTMVDPVWPQSDNTWDSGAELLQAAGLNVLADITDTRVYFDNPGLQPDHWQNVNGYCSWGVHNGNPSDYILNSLGFEYRNGACFMSYESFNAWDTDAPTDADIQRQGQGQICDFFRKGGTVAIGNVYEPYTIGVGDERWVFDRYINHGDRWIEAAYKGLRLLSWMEVVVGDPLCRVKP